LMEEADKWGEEAEQWSEWSQTLTDL
jgi:hypothetical protein